MTANVHGIVSDDPPTIVCDGCGHRATGERMAVLAFTCGITFNHGSDDKRRLCRDCAKRAGWAA
jgi:hypothetical protein